MDFTVENILIPADHPCFEGHFPGHPVFPAVTQIDLVLDHLQETVKRDLTLVAIWKAKFPAPIVPGVFVHISLKYQHPLVFWQIFGNDKTYSQGTMQIDDNVL